jgi:hypothetical protein
MRERGDCGYLTMLVEGRAFNVVTVHFDMNFVLTRARNCVGDMIGTITQISVIDIFYRSIWSSDDHFKFVASLFLVLTSFSFCTNTNERDMKYSTIERNNQIEREE